MVSDPVARSGIASKNRTTAGNDPVTIPRPAGFRLAGQGTHRLDSTAVGYHPFARLGVGRS